MTAILNNKKVNSLGGQTFAVNKNLFVNISLLFIVNVDVEPFQYSAVKMNCFRFQVGLVYCTLTPVFLRGFLIT